MGHPVYVVGNVFHGLLVHVHCKSNPLQCLKRQQTGHTTSYLFIHYEGIVKKYFGVIIFAVLQIYTFLESDAVLKTMQNIKNKDKIVHI